MAEVRLQESYAALEAAGRRNVLSTVATIFAECRYRQGRSAKPTSYSTSPPRRAPTDDFVTQVRLRAGRAKLLARRGNDEEAEAVARDAVALAAETEFIDLRGDSLLALGEVLRHGRPHGRRRGGEARSPRTVGGERERRVRRPDATPPGLTRAAPSRVAAPDQEDEAVGDEEHEGGLGERSLEGHSLEGHTDEGDLGERSLEGHSLEGHTDEGEHHEHSEHRAHEE